ncbi:cyclin-D3-2-like isoform X1 [Zingiber officinale]|uniref:cyclin-D3-2-like isoform X1 n=1 Tax=Zingiber officinale TaxID=94328 RepID=UPI001C4B9F6E|nr:cyclin-D3-2-like isoform X1 [Zingiber officinale]
MALLSLYDHLYCQEEIVGLEDEQREELPLPAAEAEEEWEEFLYSLSIKEVEFLPKPFTDEGSAGAGDGEFYLRSARTTAVEWVAQAAARHGFSAVTALLAVNYLDRCFLPCSARGELLRLQDNKPWMVRLAAVGCLSLAAKMEETRVPLLVDLQEPSEDGGFLFEPKTIRRMELLVLSALGWRMNPVTPLSFIHHLLPRICSKAKTTETDFAGAGIVHRVRALTARCETALLSVMADRRWVRYPASVWAAATLLEATEASADGDHHLLSLNAPKKRMEECYQLILERTRTGKISHKRNRSSVFRFSSSPASPSGVIGSCFSCESSCDSWAAPPSKRNKGGMSIPLTDGEDGVH